MAQSQFARVIAEAERLDARRRAQIENQKNAITRLLARIAELEELLGATVAEGMEHIMGKRRDAFEAGYEAGSKPAKSRPDVDEAFDDYKESLEDTEDTEDTNAAE